MVFFRNLVWGIPLQETSIVARCSSSNASQNFSNYFPLHISVQTHQNQKTNFIYRNFPFYDVKNLLNIMARKFGNPSHLELESNRSVNSKLILKKFSKAIAKYIVYGRWAQNTACCVFLRNFL